VPYAGLKNWGEGVLAQVPVIWNSGAAALSQTNPPVSFVGAADPFDLVAH